MVLHYKEFFFIFIENTILIVLKYSVQDACLCDIKFVGEAAEAGGKLSGETFYDAIFGMFKKSRMFCLKSYIIKFSKLIAI